MVAASAAVDCGQAFLAAQPVCHSHSINFSLCPHFLASVHPVFVPLIALPITLPSDQRRTYCNSKTRKPCYRKDDRAMRLYINLSINQNRFIYRRVSQANQRRIYMDALKIFGSSWLRRHRAVLSAIAQLSCFIYSKYTGHE